MLWFIINSTVRKEKMPKLMQQIVLFIEPAEEAYHLPSKIGNLLMNRFAVGEDTNYEILKILNLEHSLDVFLDHELPKNEGIDLILLKFCFLVNILRKEFFLIMFLE